MAQKDSIAHLAGKVDLERHIVQWGKSSGCYDWQLCSRFHVRILGRIDDDSNASQRFEILASKRRSKDQDDAAACIPGDQTAQHGRHRESNVDLLDLDKNQNVEANPAKPGPSSDEIVGPDNKIMINNLDAAKEREKRKSLASNSPHYVAKAMIF